MKYIRTTTGVYKIGRNFKLKVEENIHIPNEGVVKIINQAETIEELCDEFVCVDKITKCHTTWKGYDPHDLLLEDYDWYGAIWTDKGLIYVAKMNEKGELELL